MTDSGKSAKIDMEQALLDPGGAFGSPDAIVRNEALTREQKIELLRRWEYDARENAVALEEGMPGGESDLLRRIVLALDRLTGGIDTEQAGPAKAGGGAPSAEKRK